jgi:hypothetical protein
MFPGTTDLRSSLKSNPHVAVSFSCLGVLVVQAFLPVDVFDQPPDIPDTVSLPQLR